MNTKQSKAAKVRALLAEGLDAPAIAKKVKCTRQYVYMIKTAWKAKKAEAAPKSGLKLGLNHYLTKLYKDVADRKLAEKERLQHVGTEVRDALEALESKEDCAVERDADPINSPPHYTAGGVETIEFIEAKSLNYHLGNCVKYLSRAGIKSENKLEDLRKAQWYLDREIDRLAGHTFARE